MKRPVKLRLLMADDHTIVLEGIRKLLENDFDLVGTVEDGKALLRAAQELRPDVVLMDISMPVLNGIEACRQLVKLLPGVRVIFLTMHMDVVYVEEAFRVGGSGYLLKRSAASELTTAIDTVMRGRRYVTPLLDWNEAPPSPQRKSASGFGAARLSPRQREVLQLVAEGRANKEIAALLHISEKTVDFHKSCIKRELSLTSTAELTQFAIRHHVINA